MGAYCAIDMFGLVLSVGRDPDDAISQVSRHKIGELRCVVACTDDVVACFVAGNDVMIRMVRGVADI